MGAPNCFVSVHNIVGVLVVGVNQGNQYLFLGMSKRAEVTILAGSRILSVVLAKLGLVAGWMVKLLDFVVGALAVAIVLGARNVAVVVEVRSATVLFVVVVEANFAFVSI